MDIIFFKSACMGFR